MTEQIQSTDTRLFGWRLFFARSHKGMSQQELADRLGVHRVTVNRWEQSRQYPPLDVALRLAALLGMRLDDLSPEHQRTLCS